jgi:hypothetical protein
MRRHPDEGDVDSDQRILQFVELQLLELQLAVGWQRVLEHGVELQQFEFEQHELGQLHIVEQFAIVVQLRGLVVQLGFCRRRSAGWLPRVASGFPSSREEVRSAI